MVPLDRTIIKYIFLYVHVFLWVFSVFFFKALDFYIDSHLSRL